MNTEEFLIKKQIKDTIVFQSHSKRIWLSELLEAYAATRSEWVSVEEVQNQKLAVIYQMWVNGHNESEIKRVFLDSFDLNEMDLLSDFSKNFEVEDEEFLVWISEVHGEQHEKTELGF